VNLLEAALQRYFLASIIEISRKSWIIGTRDGVLVPGNHAFRYIWSSGAIHLSMDLVSILRVAIHSSRGRIL
jgi:hypothetical protein